MANNITISSAAKNAALDAVLALLNVGGAGHLDVFDGAQPAGPGTAVSTQTRGARLTFSATAFGVSSGGTATAASITSDTAAVAINPATWFRCSSGGGTAVIDGTVGTSGADINFNTTNFPTGATVAISSLTFTHP